MRTERLPAATDRFLKTSGPSRIVLASSSPRRRELLSRAGFEFEVCVTDVPEPLLEHLTPAELALRHAKAKATAAAELHADAITIGADTVVALDHEAFGKPATLEEAAGMLERLAGRQHNVFTGVWICFPEGGIGFIERTGVRFRPLNGEKIRHYLSLIQPLDKAGGYAAQEHGELIIEEMNGHMSNVIGLPIESLAPALRDLMER